MALAELADGPSVDDWTAVGEEGEAAIFVNMPPEGTLKFPGLGGKAGTRCDALAIAASNEGEGAIPEYTLTGSLSGRMTN